MAARITEAIGKRLSPATMRMDIAPPAGQRFLPGMPGMPWTALYAAAPQAMAIAKQMTKVRGSRRLTLLRTSPISIPAKPTPSSAKYIQVRSVRKLQAPNHVNDLAIVCAPLSHPALRMRCHALMASAAGGTLSCQPVRGTPMIRLRTYHHPPRSRIRPPERGRVASACESTALPVPAPVPAIVLWPESPRPA